jgi:hypothetical protein
MKPLVFLPVILIAACAPTAKGLIDDASPADLQNAALRSSLFSRANANVLYVTAVTPLPKDEETPERHYFGSVKIEGEDKRHPKHILYENYGQENQTECGGRKVTTRSATNGEVRTTQRQDGAWEFDIDLVQALAQVDTTCKLTTTRWAARYSGVVRDEGEERVYSGSGQVVVDRQRVQTSTEDERVNRKICDTEPLSGTTTISAGTDVASVIYDGLSFCQMGEGVRPTAPITLNGEDAGTVEVSACSSATPELFVWVVAAWVFGFGRRRVKGRRTTRAPISATR